jgi:hypothetical protein
VTEPVPPTPAPEPTPPPAPEPTPHPEPPDPDPRRVGGAAAEVSPGRAPALVRHRRALGRQPSVDNRVVRDAD